MKYLCLILFLLFAHAAHAAELGSCDLVVTFESLSTVIIPAGIYCELGLYEPYNAEWGFSSSDDLAEFVTIAISNISVISTVSKFSVNIVVSFPIAYTLKGKNELKIHYIFKDVPTNENTYIYSNPFVFDDYANGSFSTNINSRLANGWLDCNSISNKS